MKNKLRIVAAGSGIAMGLPPIVNAVLDLIPRAARETEFCLVYLGTASYDEQDRFQKQTAAYQELENCRVVKLDVSERASESVPTEEELRSSILSAHAIMVSGGNTLYAVNRWKKLKIDCMIREAIETSDTPPVLCGGSAGAICWFDHGHSDSMDPTSFLNVDPNLTEEQKKDWEYIRVQGLGYIPALCVPHHDATQSNGLPRSQDSDAMLLRYPDQPSIGIEEKAALVVSDGGKVRTVSGDGKAGCVVKMSAPAGEAGDSRGEAVADIKAVPFLEQNGAIAMESLLAGSFA